ncbi:MAG: iron-sulfur cluster-binding protein [Burkholderiales bacterium]|nr:iron-sulfur cluster-binding protein [Burkholderiales bacterium]
MQPQSLHFKERAAAELANTQLQSNMRRFGGRFVAARAKVLHELGDFEGMRTAAAAARDRALADLDVWIERFEREATRRGATVLFAETGAEVADLVLELCRRHGVRKVAKSKSMLSEEASLNQRLASAGVQPVETDLGEYILQLAHEPPSHIIAPAIHKSTEQIADLFVKAHGRARTLDIPQLTREAREVLRGHFLTADMGISGGNFLIAETGSLALVTNEGNGRMVTTLPRVHVCITGIEKVLPTLEDLSLLMRLLPRSATGQSISNYFTMVTGTRQPGDRDGPDHMYFILVDNGRTNLVGGDMQEMLRCIRCGACMNHCPVYQTIGGHAYGWVYPGPMGSVLTPTFIGLENALDLPHASTLCGECGVVCPVKIPLPELLRKLREQQVDRGLRPKSEMLGIRVWSWLALRPRLYALATRIAARYLRFQGGGRRMIRHLPFGAAWTRGRDMPAPAGKTFRELFAKKNGAG